MKNLAVATTILLSLFAAPQVKAETYLLDKAHTSAIFGISHMGFSYTYGRFNKVDGKYTLDETNPSASSFQLTIDASSVDTNDAKRDEHLRGPDFLSSNEFPTISFQSTNVAAEKNEKGESVYQVTGNLTIHGVTRPVTLPLKLLKIGEGMDGKKRSGFICETRLARSEFGMTNMIPMVGDDVAVTISFEGGVE